MSDLRAAAQQALEAMLNFPDDISDEMFESITALRAALAEPVPVDRCANCLRPKGEHQGDMCPRPYTTVWSAWDYEAALAGPQSTHSEECYKWHHECAIARIEETEELREALKAELERTLTDEQISDLWHQSGEQPFKFARMLMK